VSKELKRTVGAIAIVTVGLPLLAGGFAPVYNAAAELTAATGRAMEKQCGQ
jgi:hypothetical protein